MLSSQRIVVSWLLFALFPVLVRAQAAAGLVIRPAESAGMYEDSAMGLRLQLQEALAAARGHDRARLESLIRQMEIPNSEAWFTKTYGQAKGESWAGPYARETANRERDLEAAFLEFGMEAGEFSTRKLNDTAERMEAGMISELQQPADIYYAGWRKQGLPPSSKGELIGYFVFLEGRFRWDSTIVGLRVLEEGRLSGYVPDISGQSGSGKDDRVHRPGVNGVTYPTCVYCPDPHYPPQAREQGLDGVVVLSIVVEPSGTADNIELVKTSDPAFVDMAMEAVRQWRFKPAVDANSQPVATKVPVEMTFRTMRSVGGGRP